MSQAARLVWEVGVVLLVILGPCVSAEDASSSAAIMATPPEDMGKLLSIVRSSDAPLFDRAMACKRLAVIGTKEAVPVLAALLADEKLAHYARYALEPIPDPSVDAALREALGKLKGNLLIGVISSCGARQDAKAVGRLSELLSEPDPAVAGAAARTLGRIGTREAAQALEKSLPAAPAKLRPDVAEGCLRCAEALLQQGHKQPAAALYEAVAKADLPKHFHVAAAQGKMQAVKGGGQR